MLNELISRRRIKNTKLHINFFNSYAMRKNALIFLVPILVGNSIIAQNIYKLKECELSFSTPEKLIAVYDNPGYALYKNDYIQVSMTSVRSMGIQDIQDELLTHFPEGEYTITQMTKPIQTDNLKALFYFAKRTGYSSQFAKGIVVKGGKNILVEIKFEPVKLEEVNGLIKSFLTDDQVSEINTKHNANNDDKTGQGIVKNEQGSVQNEVDIRYDEEQELKVTSVEVEKPKTQKYPTVDHPNLIVLTDTQKKEFIDAHNNWRAEVGVPPLVWSEDLENYAAEWAVKKGLEDCNMEHRTDHLYGENLYWSSGMDFYPKGAVDSWGSEIKDYHGEVVGQSNGVVGHYTQVVWRTTTEVGCAAFKCGSALLVVCNYNPPGNYVGQHPYK